MTSKTSGARGFTLFEVLGVVLVMALLLGAAVSFFLNLTRQAVRATESTREVRRATALVDRIAVDLEHALLVKKPAEADSISQPWLFVAESRYVQPSGESGSDQIKFIRREIPRASDGPASDIAMVAYTLHRNEKNGDFQLRRWSKGELPETLERDFPRSDDPASLVLADDLRYFALRFLDENGEWKDRWDSTQLVDSSELPVTVEIEVALAPPRGESAADAALEPVHYARAVVLPLRPIDLEAMLEPEEEEGPGTPGEDEGDQMAQKEKTIGECIDLAKVPALSGPEFAKLSAVMRNAPFKLYAVLLAGHPDLDPSCL